MADDRGLLAPLDPNFQAWAREQAAAGRMPKARPTPRYISDSPPSRGKPAAAPAPAADPKPATPRAQAIQFWTSKGAPPHVAEGIADRIQAESSFKPLAQGDKGTSVGLYQHHADRMAKLMAQPNWHDPSVQHQFAYSEVTGGDPMASKHWQEILAAPDRATAAKLWDKYFERSAGGGGGVSAGTRPMGGRFGGMGPRVPLGASEIDAPAPASPARTALGAALNPVPGPPAAAPASPEAAPIAAPQQRGLHLQPTSLPHAPNLGQTYRDAISAILSGKRRPFGSMFD